MKDYLKRLLELAVAGALAAGGSYVAQNGFELSQAGVSALVGAVVTGVYGIVAKKIGQDADRPTIK